MEQGASTSAHNLWEQTFDAVSDPISIVDEQYRVVAANTAYKRLFELPEDAPPGHLCFAVDHSGYICDGCPLEITIETRAPHMVRQERLVKTTEGDSIRWERRTYQRWTYPLIDNNSTVHRVVEILRDVTEQERVRALTTEAEALRKADQLKTELLGAVSHELRSPLATIKGYADTLARYESRLTRDERREFLSAISQASDRLGEEIERLLLLSRLESGDEAFDDAPVDMAQLAREAALSARDHAHGRVSIAVITDVERDEQAATPLARGDQRRLREALDALVDNAVKYSREGGLVTIEVREGRASSPDVPSGDMAGAAPVRRNRMGQRQVEVIVSDDGRGIPHESQPRIFDAFHRVETGLTRTVEGLGLGLAICKRIVTMSGGLLWVESAPNAGSAFHMLLPAFEADGRMERRAYRGGAGAHSSDGGA